MVMIQKVSYMLCMILVNCTYSYRLIPPNSQSFFPFQENDICQLNDKVESHHGHINEGILQYHKFMEAINHANIFHKEESNISPYFSEMKDNSHNILSSNYYELMGKIDEYLDPVEKMVGKKIVVLLSSFLPNIDQIGHKILHANNLFISKVLNECSLSDEIKAKIVLTVIDISQQGDNMGSVFLQMYRNIVDWALNSANHVGS